MGHNSNISVEIFLDEQDLLSMAHLGTRRALQT